MLKSKYFRLFIVLFVMVVAAFVNVYAQTVTTNQSGTEGGYYYLFWNNTPGAVSMDLNGGGSYSVNWTYCGDFTCGKGWNPGSGHTISFSGSYTCTGGGAFGIHGWTTNPLIEYYIVEKTGDQGGPAGPTHGTLMGTVTSDGSTYAIYKYHMAELPSMGGTPFDQYINIRQSQRTSGTITIQNHFNAWKNLGMNLGTMSNQIFLTEGWSGSGSSSCTVSEVSNPTPGNPNPTPTPVNPTPTPGGTGGTTVQCEGMTKSGQYTRNIFAPFTGVALYANNDAVSSTQYFQTGTHSFSLRGCSNNSNMARVDLQIDGQKKGTFNYSGSNPATYTLSNVYTGTGNHTVKLVVTADTGQWDVCLDYLTIQ